MKRVYITLFAVVAGTLLAATAPPEGIKISDEDHAFLNVETERLAATILTLNESGQNRFLTDVMIFHNAVRYALDHNMFYKTTDAAVAKGLLKHGFDRASLLQHGKHPWTKATGLIVRGYVSRIDGSVQPYGLEVPGNYSPKLKKKWRLDVWLHGRNNNLSEVRFLAGRLAKPGQFTPKDTIVLHPYGRFCNAYKFAGEVDVLEGIAHVQGQYSVDGNRITMRGFSMGGAGAWHLGAHHAGTWAAVAPGAGFVETAVYQNIWSKTPKPTWWEQKLWNIYDVPPIAANFANTTMVAYSGEIDKQKQAADLMAVAFKKEGMRMTHIIGPKTGHKYEFKAKLKVAELVDAAARKGTYQNARKVRLTTHTLRHNQMKWVTLMGLDEHWKEARVEAEYLGDWAYTLKTQNVSALMLGLLEGFNQTVNTCVITIDGQTLSFRPKRGANIRLRKFDGRWEVVLSLKLNSLVKLPGLQGPIDDAFLDRFIMVRPTGKTINAAVGKWVRSEMDHAITQWHRQFRGKAIVKDDIAITAGDIASANLILWGDTSSNKLLAKIAGQIPIEWTAKGVRLKGKTWPADKFVPALIYPNPLNLERYIVVNSGFTFSEYGHMSNSMQNAKLPDYAVLDMRVPIRERIPKGVTHAGFFGERWELTESEGKD